MQILQFLYNFFVTFQIFIYCIFMLYAWCLSSWSERVGTLKGQKVVKKLHRMWNWDDIKNRLVACVRTSRGDEQTAQI